MNDLLRILQDKQLSDPPHPRQVAPACPDDLATNDLATSFQSGGRLNGLLTAGLRYAAATRLTWAVDPALLSDPPSMPDAYPLPRVAEIVKRAAQPAIASRAPRSDPS